MDRCLLLHPVLLGEESNQFWHFLIHFKQYPINLNALDRSELISLICLKQVTKRSHCLLCQKLVTLTVAYKYHQLQSAFQLAATLGIEGALMEMRCFECRIIFECWACLKTKHLLKWFRCVWWLLFAITTGTGSSVGYLPVLYPYYRCTVRGHPGRILPSG